MIVDFDKSFAKSLGKIKDQSVLKRIESVILKLESAERIEDLSNIKKLQGHTAYYRIKVGDYRIGFEKTDANRLTLIIALHRKDIYNQFP
ncbi:type II toxin-antitoxin system RelE/ParE family toxin [Algoriphagus sp. A40]|uniref:type II toxin-antitoxin system RelE family toxin n=1 Tax=Algoriphagus sp. A40 TaxID=1945863 RepID=UPI000987652C|nr:type II toxin-antitoxin system RelE/ParE family toxin [Algoriphagus sp. A40]OOG75322.1 plasmid stabilization protein [Algoriphagus sp. A40]